MMLRYKIFGQPFLAVNYYYFYHCQTNKDLSLSLSLITPTRAEGGLVFFSLLRPFLIEGVFGLKNLFSES